jgi:flagellar assembly protein FliH
MAEDSMQHDNKTNYQRWQPSPLVEAGAETLVQKVKLPTAEALEGIHRQAYQEGYESGYAEGLEKGLADARQQGGQQVRDEVQRLQSVLAGVEEAIRELGKATSEDLLGLALELSRQMLRQSLKVKPELLLPIVQNVMESIPQHSQHPHLYLHPADAALVKANLQTEISLGGWKIAEDPRIERGGCKIETSSAEIDATLENRWQHLASSLGKNMSWLDDDGAR